MVTRSKNPHFFQLNSRLGLRFAPSGSTILNTGVEHGPKAVLTPAFVNRFPGAVMSSFDFSLPEKVHPDDYYNLLTQEFEQAINLIQKDLKDDEIQVVIGGDHSVAFASVATVLQRINPQDVGLLFFDSHGDLNTCDESLSGNFHGMWLRAVVDTFDYAGIDALIPAKLPLENLGLIGNMILDPAEVTFIARNNCLRFSDAAQLRQWLLQFEHVHISFDIDVFKKDLVPATGTPNPNGCDKEHIFSLLSECRDLSSYSLDLVEVNPMKPGAAQTVALAQEVVSKLLL